MQYPVAIIASFALFLSLGSRERLEIRDSFEFEPTAQTVRRIRWPKKTIEVAFSNSLLAPGTNIKPDSDVVGAARRALLRWSSLTNINFVVTWSAATSVSPSDAGDGISLLTIATTPENEAFNSEATTGRTRVFFDSQTGSIAEADIVINPRPKADDGTEIQFSTDGTPGTYDLEATFTHEIGHLLGLDHSAVLSSTMQSRQAFNGTFGLPALTERTLSEDDRQKVRSLYGPKQNLGGRIEGKLVDNRTPGSLIPLNGANVWAENVATGRVIASAITADDGSYRLESLSPGQYRVMVAAGPESATQKFRSFELSSQVTVKAELPTALNSSLVPSQTSALNPKVIGLNAELSTVALPLAPGKRVKIYLGGEGVDQVPGTNIAVNSPFFTVDPATLAREQIAAPFPIVSVEVQVAPNVPFGDYSLKLQSNSGETAYVPGAITIDPGVLLTVANPVDDSRFFIMQQYADLIGREPELSIVDKLSAQLAQCNSRPDCLRAKRVEISTGLLVENELPATGVFVYGLYSAALGRAPRIAEFESDRTSLANQKGDLEAARLGLATNLVERAEFKRKFAAMRSIEFVDSILASIHSTGVDLSADRSTLIGLADDGPNGRAAVLARIAADQRVIDANYNHAFVMFQYFTHLRRNPDEAGYAAWVNTLKSKPLRDPDAARSIVCNFLSSPEYQNRFGMVATHHTRDCN